MTAPQETFVTKLTQAFNRKSLAHLAIDLQDLYCDPLHRYNTSKGRHYAARAQRAGRAADAVGSFVKEYREAMPHIWVTHNCASIYGHSPGFAKFHLDMLARETLHHSLPVNDNDPLICKQGFSAFLIPTCTASCKKTELIRFCYRARLPMSVFMTRLPMPKAMAMMYMS